MEEDSVQSSPSHGFRRGPPSHQDFDNRSVRSGGFENVQHEPLSFRPGTLSPAKVGRVYLEQIKGTNFPPKYDEESDYFKEFWRLYL